MYREFYMSIGLTDISQMESINWALLITDDCDCLAAVRLIVNNEVMAQKIASFIGF